MVICAFLGCLGSGKTTLCTRHIILTKKLHPEKKLYINYELKNMEFNKLDLMDLYINHPEERQLIIGADEFYTMMDCRVSGSYRNRVESYFIAMCRKAEADFFMTMQFETFVDCRISPFVKVKYIMEQIPVYKTIYLNGSPFTYKRPHPYLFKVHLIDERDDRNIVEKDFIFDGRKWFNEFNSYEYVRPPEDVIRTMQIKQMKDKVTYDKLKKQCEEIDNKENGIHEEPTEEVKPRRKKKKS